MPSLPWKKSKSTRISRFVSDFQQSPKHGGSLVVETGFPTSLIDLFVKNRNRLKKQSSKRKTNTISSSSSSSSFSHPPPRLRLSSPSSSSSSHHPPPLSSSSSLPRHRSLPVNLDQEEERVTSKIEEIIEDRNDVDDGGDHREGGGCALMVVAFKVFVVAVLALSTKKLAVGVTLSAFTLLFLEFAVARVFTLLNICPNATEVRIDSLIVKLIGKNNKKSQEEIVDESRKNKVTFEIIEEAPIEQTIVTEDSKPVVEEVVTIRDVVFQNEKSKSARLKSKIVKKIVPKKLRSYKKKRKMKEEKEEIEIIGEDGEEEEGSVTEVSSLYSEDRVESEISERDDVSSNPPPLLESCEEIEEGDLTKVIGLIVIVLTGLLIGKVLAIGLTLSWCLILKAFYCKSRTSL